MNTRNGPLLTATALVAALWMAACSKTPEMAAALPAASASLPNVADSDVSEHVKTALQQNDALKGFDIQVVTLQGDVRLTGIVDSQAQIDEAIRIARAADGAHAIHDELTIKK